MDISNPAQAAGHDRPYLIIVDMFSRMTVSGEVMDLSTQSSIDFRSHRRMPLFGRTGRLITGNGANSVGGKFEASVSVWNITHVCTPAYSAYQSGIFEHTAGMLNVWSEAARKKDPSPSWAEAVNIAVSGRNLSTLLDREVAPIAIMTGRRNILDFITVREFVSDDKCASIHIPSHEMKAQ